MEEAYKLAYAASAKAIKEFNLAKQAFRNKEISAKEYCIAFAKQKAAMKLYDQAHARAAGWIK